MDQNLNTNRNVSEITPSLEVSLSKAFRHIQFESDGRSIVNLGSLDQDKIAKLTLSINQILFNDKTILSVEEVLLAENRIVGDIVVTGYSNSLSEDDEKVFQARIRAAAFKDTSMRIIVLSSTLPKEDVFNMSLPWYNGPFENKSPFSMHVQGQNVIVQKFDTTGGGISMAPKRWTVDTKEVFTSD